MFGVVSCNVDVAVSMTPGTPSTTPSIRSTGRRAVAINDSRSVVIARNAPSASAPRNSTSWRARTSPLRSQTAPRRKRAPRSSPSTYAASGTGSKNTAP